MDGTSHLYIFYFVRCRLFRGGIETRAHVSSRQWPRPALQLGFSALSAGVALAWQQLAEALARRGWPELPSLVVGAKPNWETQTATPGKAAQIGLGTTGFGGSWHETRADILNFFTSSFKESTTVIAVLGLFRSLPALSWDTEPPIKDARISISLSDRPPPVAVLLKRTWQPTHHIQQFPERRLETAFDQFASSSAWQDTISTETTLNTGQLPFNVLEAKPATPS